MINPLPFVPELYLAIAIFLGGFVAGFAGFGLASAAGAILLHVKDPTSAVPLMMVCSIIAQVAGLLYLRKGIECRTSFPFILGGLLGVPLAVAIFHRVDAESFRIGFGAFLVGYAAYTLFQQAFLAANVRRAVLATPVITVEAPDQHTHTSLVPRAGVAQILIGFGGGFVGGLTAMPGALITIWCDLQSRSKCSQRGVVQPFILAMQVLSLLLMAANTDVLREDLVQEVGLSLPFLAAGTALGLFLFGKVDNRNFRTAVLLVILLSGAGLVLR